jgi:serine/threonine protein kinase
VSAANLTPELEKQIFEAFDAIHGLGVLHCDTRPENILVGKDGEGVWVIDFEFASIVQDGDSKREDSFAAERKHVVQLLAEAKTSKK